MNSKPLPVQAVCSKDKSLEVLRGLAILLVVSGHVIGIDTQGGMRAPDDSVWRYLYASLQHIRMPFFTAISGAVYAIYPVHRGLGASFVLKKVRRLLLPMAFVGTLYFLVQYITPGTNSDGVLSEIWKIYIFPYTLYWYLPSLFMIFLFMALLDIRRVCGTFRAWCGWLAFACALVVVEPLLSANLPNVLGIWGAVCLFPFFLIGVGIHRFAAQLTTPYMRRLYVVGFCLGLLAQQMVWFAADDPGLLRDWYLHTLIGIFSSAFLLTRKWHSRFLIWLGSYAYGIYLFHGFGTSGGRILLQAAGVHSSVAAFLFSVLLGLGVPILVEYALRHFPLLQTLFLGKKYRPRFKTE